MNRCAKGLSASFVAVAVALLTACGDGGAASDSIALSDDGGDVTVLLDTFYAGAWPAGLDPATNTTARANMSQMNAIFGGLFQLMSDGTRTGTEIVGVLASGYEISDGGRTVIIRLRDGVVFSDGTPFDAAAVKFNMERNLGSACTCAPTSWPWSDGERISTEGTHTVMLHFSRPHAAVMNSFPVSNLNWIASPTALEAMGEEAFRIAPVGAGPFRVVSNQLSSRLVLERNPLYWEAGKPHLDRLTFQSIGSEQAAYQSLVSGDAQAYEGMTSTPLIEQAIENERLTVTQQPATAPYVIQLNTRHAPLDDRRAREAIYYATDAAAIRTGVFNDWYPVSQSFTGPGGLFYQETIPGYREFDPERARELVDELGGLEVTLGTLRSFVAEQVVTALHTQWEAAGITVNIEMHDLATMIREHRTGGWDAMLQTAGSYDPEAGAGVSFRFRSDGVYSGVSDTRLDSLLDRAMQEMDPAERGNLYLEAATLIGNEAYAPFLLAFSPTQITDRNLEGPGLTTEIPPIFIQTGVIWQDVRKTND